MKKIAKWLLIAAALLLIGCLSVPPALYFGSPEPKKLKLPDTLPEQISTETLAADMHVWYSDSGESMQSVEGEFVPFRIRRPKKAYLAIAAFSEALGIDDVRNDLRYEAAAGGLIITLIAGHYFTFTQYYQDIPVEGGMVMVVSDRWGKPVELYSSYRPGIVLETTEPKLTAAEAERIAAKYDMNETSRTQEPALIVSFDAENRPVLAWQIFFESDHFPYYVTVNAITGEIVYDSQTDLHMYSGQRTEGPADGTTAEPEETIP